MNFLDVWATCISLGIPDREWEYMTIPKIRALSKLKRERDIFWIKLHGGEVEDKRPIVAKTLADLGFMPKGGSR